MYEYVCMSEYGMRIYACECVCVSVSVFECVYICLEVCVLGGGG